MTVDDRPSAKEMADAIYRAMAALGVSAREVERALGEFSRLMAEIQVDVEAFPEEYGDAVRAEAELRLFLRTAAWVTPVFILATAVIAILATS